MSKTEKNIYVNTNQADSKTKLISSTVVPTLLIDNKNWVRLTTSSNQFFQKNKRFFGRDYHKGTIGPRDSPLAFFLKGTVGWQKKKWKKRK